MNPIPKHPEVQHIELPRTLRGLVAGPIHIPGDEVLAAQRTPPCSPFLPALLSALDDSLSWRHLPDSALVRALLLRPSYQYVPQDYDSREGMLVCGGRDVTFWLDILFQKAPGSETWEAIINPQQSSAGAAVATLGRRAALTFHAEACTAMARVGETWGWFTVADVLRERLPSMDRSNYRRAIITGTHAETVADWCRAWTEARPEQGIDFNLSVSPSFDTATSLRWQ